MIHFCIHKKNRILPSPIIIIISEKIYQYLLICLGMLFLFHTLLYSQDDISSPVNGRRVELPKQNEEYSFLVGGHLYGLPSSPSVYPSPSLLANIDTINSLKSTFFVSLGDNFRNSSLDHINNFKKTVVLQIYTPIFIAVGNHDVINRKMYEKYFGITYYHFIINHELFLILDTELSVGSITGEQLAYFHSIIDSTKNDPDIKNIFIFSHRLLWSVNNPRYKIVNDHINSSVGYDDKYNFIKEIEHGFADLANKNVYWFSGDIGAPWSLSLFFDKNPSSNITYIATGIGDTERDAIINVKVSKSGDHVAFIPISLTSQKLSNIEYYNLTYWSNYFEQIKIPNKISDKIFRMIKHNYFYVGMLISLIFWGIIIIFFLRRYKKY